MIKKAILTLSFILIASSVFADELKLTGSINKIQAKGSDFIISVGGKELTVKDENTVSKIKEKKLVVGDEVRIKYDSNTNITKLVRKTAGC